MSGPDVGRSITFGFHPTARGFGWVAFEGPFALLDAGLYTPKGDKSAKCLKRVEELLSRFKPETVVLEAFDKTSLRSERIRELCLKVVNLAADHGAEIAVFRRGEVRSCFAGVGAKTRDEIAEAVTRTVPGLSPRLPKKRGAGDSEDKRLAIFSAAAVVLTYYHDGASRVLSDMKAR